MITQLAKFKLNMDKEAEGLQALKELCTAVEQNEPGVLAYVCHRSVKNPDELIFFEVYKDDEAMKAHGKTPAHGQAAHGISPPCSVRRSKSRAWTASGASLDSAASLVFLYRSAEEKTECACRQFQSGARSGAAKMVMSKRDARRCGTRACRIVFRT